MDAAFTTRSDGAQAHRTHQQVIGERAARDHGALKPLPPTTYLVAERHLRPVGKDCLVAFGGNLYSVPARKVRPRQLVEIRATKSQVMLHSTASATNGETLLAMHPRAVGRGVRASLRRRTGTACQPARAAGPPPATSQPSPGKNLPRAGRPGRWKPC